MSITSDRNTQGKGLQELIDSYNRELMRIHSRSGSSADSPAGQGPRGETRSAAHEEGQPGGEVSSPAQARPQSSFSLGGEPAAQPSGGTPGTLSEEERQKWLKELEDGLEELRKGLSELAKGQKELSDGLKEWRDGVNAAVGAAASPRAAGAVSPEESAKWLGELERGMEELREGMKELAKGQKALDDGMREWQEGVSGVKYRGGDRVFPFTPVFGSGGYASAGSGNGFAPAGGAHGAAQDMPAPEEAPLGPPLDGTDTEPVGYGTLCVSVNTARQAMPVRGASVIVTMPVGDRELLYSFVSTDSSGRSPSIELPVYGAGAPESAVAADGDYIPRFRTYKVRVQAAGFEIRDDLTAEIFDGISSTLNAELEPLSGGISGSGSSHGEEGM